MVFDHIFPGLLDISVRTRGQPNFRNRIVDLLEFVLLPDIYLRVRLPRVRTKIRYVSCDICTRPKEDEDSSRDYEIYFTLRMFMN